MSDNVELMSGSDSTSVPACAGDGATSVVGISYDTSFP